MVVLPANQVVRVVLVVMALALPVSEARAVSARNGSGASVWSPAASTLPAAQAGESGRVVADLIGRAVAPVYGPAGNPFDLRLLTVASGAGVGSQVAGVQLLFADFQPEGTRVALLVRSIHPLLAAQRTPEPEREAVQASFNPYHDLYIDLQLDGRGAPRAYPTGEPERSVREVEIAGAVRSVELAYWPAENGFLVYALAGDGMTVAGGALGLTPDDVAVVLAGLARLDQHPELVEQYDAEYQAHGQAVARLNGAGPRPGDDPSLRHRMPIPARTHQSGGIGVAGFGNDGQNQRQYLYDIVNLSNHFALMVEHSFPFDGGFTLVLPPGLRPRVTLASGIACAPGAEHNTLDCRMEEEIVQLVFVAEPAGEE